MTMATDEQKVSMALLPHQQRVIEEKRELDERLAKLLAFFDTKTYNDLQTEDRLLLIAQHTHMTALTMTLAARISRFGR